jgi:hypothetical protein
VLSLIYLTEHVTKAIRVLAGSESNPKPEPVVLVANTRLVLIGQVKRKFENEDQCTFMYAESEDGKEIYFIEMGDFDVSKVVF